MGRHLFPDTDLLHPSANPVPTSFEKFDVKHIQDLPERIQHYPTMKLPPQIDLMSRPKHMPTASHLRSTHRTPSES
jgi:hypothetical protein